MKKKFAYFLLVAMVAAAPFTVKAHDDPELAKCRSEQTEDIKLIQKQTDMIRKLTKAVEDQTKLIKDQDALIAQQDQMIKKLSR